MKRRTNSFRSAAAPARAMTAAAAMDRVPPPAGPEAVAAGIALSPELAAALSLDLMMGKNLAEAGIDPATVTQTLNAGGRAAADGDLSQVRRTLTAQVATLDRMFHHLFQLAHSGGLSHDLFERYLRLALRAQAQCARTIGVLGRLCPEPARENTAQPQAKTAHSPRPAAPARSPDLQDLRKAPAPAPSFPKEQELKDRDGDRSRASAALHGLSAPAGG